MMDGRIPWPENSEIALNGTVYTLRSASLEDPGILYTAIRANTSAWEDIVIREIYPKRAALTRQANGRITADAGLELLQRARKTAALGQQAEEQWLQPCGGHSELVDACGTSYVIRRFPKALPLHAMVKQGPMPAGAALAWTEQLLVMVESVHRAGLLHLQISPEQLYLEQNGRLILDYQFLYDRQQLSMYTSPTRQTRYAAPEVRMGYADEITEAADLYSCCAVLFEMLAGRPLKEEEIVGRRLYGTLQHILSDCTPIQRAGLTDLLYRGLHVLPHRRFPSAATMRSTVSQVACAARHSAEQYHTIPSTSRR